MDREWENYLIDLGKACKQGLAEVGADTPTGLERLVHKIHAIGTATLPGYDKDYGALLSALALLGMELTRAGYVGATSISLDEAKALGLVVDQTS